MSCRLICSLVTHAIQISFKTQPPPGYTFIAAGDPDLTKELKDIARRDGKKMYTVTVSLANGG